MCQLFLYSESLPKHLNQEEASFWIFLINFKLDIAFLCLLQVWNVSNHQNACNVGVFKKVMLQLEITIGHMGVVQATFILLLVQNILYNTDNYNAASTGLTIQ